MPTYFDAIPHIKYEGPASANPLAFKHYDAQKTVLGKTMAELDPATKLTLSHRGRAFRNLVERLENIGLKQS